MIAIGMLFWGNKSAKLNGTGSHTFAHPCLK